ncbi:hypothetical protein C9374_013372 [Naegleria lovaniensis]|uniref:DNA/RNA-binding protein Alba-like domain-containing protein n=1 Tax=Naegleria lovaniensis TaxID=51637 RepID=A0AA88H219_NAELO|nr:uncharacterized protein C9374_013372 [Naegleria lovaniensis]KAG2391887.1 hypothetical protein C9374_013372 [Naegleria lovaniensis]
MSQSSYKKVEKPRNQEVSSIQKNEIRITAQGRSRSYISYAVGLLDPSLLQKDEASTSTETPQQYDSVVLKAMGKAIQKAVTIAEVLKRRVAGLHQNTSIESQEIEDQYEPKEEGLDIVTKKRTVSSIIIKLSKKPLDTNALGYQPPIPEDQVTAPQIISAKKVPGGGAGKRRKRRVRRGGAASAGGAKAQQQGTTTATTKPSQGTTTPQQQQGTKQQQPSSTPSQGTSAGNRGRGGRGGRGRGRGGRGGRGQARKQTAATSQQ